MILALPISNSRSDFSDSLLAACWKKKSGTRITRIYAEKERKISVFLVHQRPINQNNEFSDSLLAKTINN